LLKVVERSRGAPEMALLRNAESAVTFTEDPGHETPPISVAVCRHGCWSAERDGVELDAMKLGRNRTGLGGTGTGWN